MGNFLILNLFLALLLNAFGEESLNSKPDEDGEPKVPLTVRIKNKILSSRRKKHRMASEIRMSSLALSPEDQMRETSPHNCSHKGKSNGNPSDGEKNVEKDNMSSKLTGGLFIFKLAKPVITLILKSGLAIYFKLTNSLHTKTSAL